MSGHRTDIDRESRKASDVPWEPAPRVLEFKTVEDCADESRTYECRLDRSLTEELIRHLGKLGKLEYFPDFALPFFKVTRRGGFLMRGVQGTSSFQIVFFGGAKDCWPLVERQLLSMKETGGATHGTAT